MAALLRRVRIIALRHLEVRLRAVYPPTDLAGGVATEHAEVARPARADREARGEPVQLRRKRVTG